MNRIYLDNAATTPLDKDVLDAMMPYLTEKFGNPSSIYSYGRESRMAIENARKSVAHILNAHPSEIFFTSGGTESTNTVLAGAVRHLGCTRIISSPLEHHATLHTLDYLAGRGEAKPEFVRVLPDGHIDLDHLRELLSKGKEKTLVSLMHANNELGNKTDMHAVGALCGEFGALFHSDTVQTVGHFPIDLRATPVHFINGSAHKFHGPKGVGILYVNAETRIPALIHGGAQERNMRAGTENLYGIVGFAKALELSTERFEQDRSHIEGLKRRMIEKLKERIPGVGFNGDPLGCSLYTILNISLPKTEKSEMLLINLDMAGICASGGSACTSGAAQGSHVIAALGGPADRVAVRFSFSRHNTVAEVDEVVEKMAGML